MPGRSSPAEKRLFSPKMCEMGVRMLGTKAAACSAPEVGHTAAGTATTLRAGCHKGNEE